jgi:hypothetical protein
MQHFVINAGDIVNLNDISKRTIENAVLQSIVKVVPWNNNFILKLWIFYWIKPMETVYKKVIFGSSVSNSK